MSETAFYLITYFLDRSRGSTVFPQVVHQGHHRSRPFIMAASSPDVVVPVSLFSWSTSVALGRPLPCCPWVGSHRMRRWAPSSGRAALSWWGARGQTYFFGGGPILIKLKSMSKIVDITQNRGFARYGGI